MWLPTWKIFTTAAIIATVSKPCLDGMPMRLGYLLGGPVVGMPASMLTHIFDQSGLADYADPLLLPRRLLFPSFSPFQVLSLCFVISYECLAFGFGYLENS